MEDIKTKERNSAREKNKCKEPGRFHVIMHNDDFTPMDFVVDILIHIFGKNQEEAVELMYRVHRGNRAIVGTYPYDIASTKASQAIECARKENYPFKVTVEKE